MRTVAPEGAMYQAGTLSGNPLAMTAGIATLKALRQPDVFDRIVESTSTLTEGIQRAAQQANIPIQAGYAGTMFGFYFLKEAGVAITNYAEARKYADSERYGRFFHAMLERGVYFAPSQFEAGFLSTTHTNSTIEMTVSAVKEVLDLR
jgi:glutamate-1-semialdehyde 2,1-aminomutase